MIPQRKSDQLLILTSAFSWAGFVLLSYLKSSGKFEDYAPQDFLEMRPIFDTLLLGVFFGSLFLYQRRHEDQIGELHFNEMLWSNFVTGAITMASLGLSILIMNMGRQEFLFPNEQSFIDFFNNVNIAIVSIFAAKTFYTFKRMILFQKTKFLSQSWDTFELMIYVSLLFNFIHIPITHPTAYISLGLFCFFTFYLALNMPWVAYLNYKQKWRNLLLLIFILAVAAAFIKYTFSESEHFNNDVIHYLVNDMLHMPFIINTFIFIILYGSTSILVIIFNLPTSSVFEQKVGEVFSFQRLSQTIHSSDDVEHIYEVFFEMSLSTTLADLGWLEIVHPNNQKVHYLYKDITKEEAFNIKIVSKQNKQDFNQKTTYIKDFRRLKDYHGDHHTRAKSMLFVPLYFQDKYLGLLCMGKLVQSGFDSEIIEVISTFAQQASLSIENSRLMHDAIEAERYKEEIKIAKQVKDRLLPKVAQHHKDFEVAIFSNSSDEVGGDYYDIVEMSPETTILLIADVSGHGTSAAFNMSQLKGAIRTCIQFEKELKGILSSLNKTLSECLDKKTFITLTAVLINHENQDLQIARAGHCPSLFYDTEKKNMGFLDESLASLGLGILRDDSFKEKIEAKTINTKKGDFILLYTDGIIEAKNENGEEYGFELLKSTVEKHADQDPSKIIELLITSLHEFADNAKINDDYTAVLLKFK